MVYSVSRCSRRLQSCAELKRLLADYVLILGWIRELLSHHLLNCLSAKRAGNIPLKCSSLSHLSRVNTPHGICRSLLNSQVHQLIGQKSATDAAAYTCESSSRFRHIRGKSRNCHSMRLRLPLIAPAYIWGCCVLNQSAKDPLR